MQDLNQQRLRNAPLQDVTTGQNAWNLQAREGACEQFKKRIKHQKWQPRLVGGIPTSVGVIIPSTWKNNKCSKPPTSIEWGNPGRWNPIGSMKSNPNKERTKSQCAACNPSTLEHFVFWTVMSCFSEIALLCFHPAMGPLPTSSGVCGVKSQRDLILLKCGSFPHQKNGVYYNLYIFILRLFFMETRNLTKILGEACNAFRIDVLDAFPFQLLSQTYRWWMVRATASTSETAAKASFFCGMCSYGHLSVISTYNPHL